MKTKTERCTKKKRLCAAHHLKWCHSVVPGTGTPYVCSRPKGHEGNHIGCRPSSTRDRDHNLASWPQAEKVKPTTPREWALRRVRLSCEIAANALTGKFIPKDGTAQEFALYCLLRAVGDLAEAVVETGKPAPVQAPGGQGPKHARQGG